MFGHYYFDTANCECRYNRLDSAAKYYVKAINSGDLTGVDYYNALLSLGRCCIALNDCTNAINYLQMAVQNDPRCCLAYHEIGRAYAICGDNISAKEYFEDAINYADDGIKNTPDYIDYWYLYGLILLTLEENEAALSAFNEAVSLAKILAPNKLNEIKAQIPEIKAKNHCDVGNKYKSESKFTEAITEYDKALSYLDVNSKLQYSIYCSKGTCYNGLKKYSIAIQEFNKAIRLDQDNEKAYLGLIASYKATRDIDNMLQCFDKISHICSTPDTKAGLKILDNDTQEKRKIARIYQTISTGMKLTINKKYHDALKFAETISESSPELITLKYRLIGDAMFHLGQFEELITRLKPYANDKDFLGGIATKIGQSYFELKHYQSALQYLDKGIENGNLEDEDGWAYKGECHTIFGQYEKAIEAYEKAIENHTKYSDFSTSLLEKRIALCREKSLSAKSKESPSHITYAFNGNSGNVNFGGLFATDDAVVNRANIGVDTAQIKTSYCPGCGTKVSSEDKFCRNCGRKLI